jgi:DNA mismatch repair ATPase MutS
VTTDVGLCCPQGILSTHMQELMDMIAFDWSEVKRLTMTSHEGRGMSHRMVEGTCYDSHGLKVAQECARAAALAVLLACDERSGAECRADLECHSLRRTTSAKESCERDWSTRRARWGVSEASAEEAELRSAWAATATLMKKVSGEGRTLARRARRFGGRMRETG